jgi:hypothetical protein
MHGMLAAVAIFAAQTASAAQDDLRPIKKQIDAPPIVLRVPLNPEEKIEADFTLSLPDDLRGTFADNPIIWEPAPNPEPLQSVLIAKPEFRDKMGIVPRLPAVKVGRDKEPGAQVEVVCADRGTLNEPRQFKLRISHPRDLPPGAYEGNMVFRLETFEPPGLVVDYYWPMYLYVEGRSVIDVRFSDLDPKIPPSSLPAGRSASVTVRVMTVGDDLKVGQGQLQLQWKRDPASVLARETILCIPLPLPAEPIDMDIDVPWLTNAICKKPILPTDPWETAWKHDVLYGLPLKEVRISTDKTKIVVYELQTRLPDVVAMGELAVVVDWERDRNTATDNVVRVESDTVTISPGVRVAPKNATQFEPVSIQVITATDLGDEVSLVVSDANGSAIQSIVATKVAGDHASLPGGQVRYKATWIASSLGSFEVRLAVGAALNQVREFHAKSGEPLARLRVDFQEGSNVETPITVFAGTPPIWWDFFHEPAGWACVRKQLFAMRGVNSEIKEVTLKGIYVDKDSHQVLLHEPSDHQREPQMDLSEPGADNAALNNKQANTWTAVHNGVVLDLKVSLDETEQNLERNALAGRDYTARFHLSGIGPDGSPVYRVVDLPFKVNVTSSAAYYRVAADWAALVLSPFFCGFIMWLIWKRGLGPRRARAQRARGMTHPRPTEPVDPLAPDTDHVPPTFASKPARGAEPDGTYASPDVIPASTVQPVVAPSSPPSSGSSFVGVSPD